MHREGGPLKKTLVAFFSLFFPLAAFAQESNPLFNPLRSLSDFVAAFDSVTTHLVFLVALLVAFIAFLAYRKVRAKRLLLISIAFSLFTLKSLLKVLDIYFSPGTFLPVTSQNVFDLLFLGALFVALFYRGELQFKKK